MSTAPGLENQQEYYWAYKQGAFGFLPVDNVTPIEDLAIPGIRRESHDGQISVEPLQSLQIPKGSHLTRSVNQRGPRIFGHPASPDLAEMRSPMMPVSLSRSGSHDAPSNAFMSAPNHHPFSQDTPRSAADSEASWMPLFPPAETHFTSQQALQTPTGPHHTAQRSGLGPAIQLEDDSPAQALTENQASPVRSTPSKSQYRPCSVRTSMFLRQTDLESNDDEVWTESVKQRDPTMSIYDAYFRPSMYWGDEPFELTDAYENADQSRDAQSLSGSGVSFDVSVEDNTFQSATREVENILPPVESHAPNRLLMGDTSFGLDTSTSYAQGPTASQSASELPIAALEAMNVSHTPEKRPSLANTPRGSIDGNSSSLENSIQPPSRSSELYARLRNGTDLPWSSNASRRSASPLTSPSKSRLRWSPQRRGQVDSRLSEDGPVSRDSIPTSRSSGSLFGSPLSKRSVDIQYRAMLSEAQLFQRWTKVLTDRNGGAKNVKRGRQLVELGVPHALRGRVWLLFAGRSMQPKPNVFQEMCDQAHIQMMSPDHAAVTQLIDMDLNQCFPLQKPFSGVDGSSRDDLKQVLHAYVLYNPEVGYKEGMCLIFGLLLTHVCVEDAFWLFDAIVKHYGMQKCYMGNMEQLHIDNAVLDELLRITDESVYQRLQDLRIEPMMFWPGWILPLYVRTLPWPTLLRFWDMFLCEGYTFVLRTAIAIIRLSRNTLLNSRKCPGRDETLRQLVFIASPPLLPDAVLEMARDLPVSDSDLLKMQRNAAKLVLRGDPVSKPIEAHGSQRPVGLKGRPISRGTSRMLNERNKVIDS
ncbi:hypothetical protein MYAM1_003519 [Malassezia yamatoensis]|uniref:Rab-GAP TBC domain-containing protein n=1 Tax=Malassezia yamatoensis TaxID=253288 RepID=A0AAJ6CKI6_9BASI|nr:hypothetical protein MYAM1_003519 [Malassezia yamatoensis]